MSKWIIKLLIISKIIVKLALTVMDKEFKDNPKVIKPLGNMCWVNPLVRVHLVKSNLAPIL